MSQHRVRFRVEPEKHPEHGFRGFMLYEEVDVTGAAPGRWWKFGEEDASLETIRVSVPLHFFATREEAEAEIRAIVQHEAEQPTYYAPITGTKS